MILKGNTKENYSEGKEEHDDNKKILKYECSYMIFKILNVPICSLAGTKNCTPFKSKWSQIAVKKEFKQSHEHWLNDLMNTQA